MKTINYNPSPFEVNLAKAIVSCRDQIQEELNDKLKITGIENKMERDNPMLVFQLQDNDGDPHEIVLKIIQRPDEIQSLKG